MYNKSIKPRNIKAFIVDLMLIWIAFLYAIHHHGLFLGQGILKLVLFHKSITPRLDGLA